jgi:hypothetical protein
MYRAKLALVARAHLAAFGMKDMVSLRIVAICSNIAFIAYGIMLNLPPVLMLHVILLPLNGWRLMEALKQRSPMAGRSYVPLRPVADVAAASLDLSWIQDRLSQTFICRETHWSWKRRAETRPFYFEDEQGQRTVMNQLLLQVVIVVAFGAFCFGCGYLTGFIVTRNQWRDEMIKRGVARYNWHTGKWEWGEPPKER